MSECVEFAVDVLYAIRAGLGSRTLPHAFEEDETDVFSDRVRRASTESNIKTAMSALGNGGNTHGVLTPDPTPNKNASLNDQTGDSSSEESPPTPSKASKGSSAVLLTDKQ